MGRLFGFLVDGVKRLLPAAALLQSPSWRKEAPFAPFANPSHRDPVKNILHLPFMVFNRSKSPRSYLR